MKTAVAKYPIEPVRDFAAFADKQARLLEAAARQGARIAVLPEYLSLELGAVFDDGVRGDLAASLQAIQSLHAPWLELFSRIAAEQRMHVIAGSFLLASGEGRYRNRSYWFTPEGRHGWQDKLQLTGFEKSAGSIDGGDVLKAFQADGIRAGISVCYDVEFPLPVRAQYEAGVRLLLVPSCTDTLAGATRVRVGCLARALENRMFVAQSVTAGHAPWSPALDVNTGEATIYAPMDAGFPADGIVAQTTGDQVWAIADLDFAAFEASRAVAQVANDRDWPAQSLPTIVRAQVEPL
ncbi:carbon-nitrogen hydrolase family protein [Pseudoxanthomonas wuyuanensis]|uniref:Predicted amidohydrolase n=1 Tax=Pseudoxanthomonas wuyuanensis TaxID=1073196 RepID=A0A286CV31_9GAMM|nr:carbon-nitrogen hydrolase family protein [Pseudoxanthomonas wuyuanensis]KAF1717346.1 nitrilase [Pseudoxanthomonas wuyuanensis]SOD50261.1 Predicted amidohydrolase [Pseudoxanthomonas wuyuanensis]